MKPAAIPGLRKIEPSRSLLQGAPYTHSTATDIRTRFEKMKPPTSGESLIWLDEWQQTHLRSLK